MELLFKTTIHAITILFVISTTVICLTVFIKDLIKTFKDLTK